ncbi:hypothetical protein L602_004500000130 [Cupriavidus gilardii J11]|uniref:Uncharacterized protein n=1 Tax=Cupriavidus gilardii J11 TaxID=936133 RepID=A0A562B895_9BURK|nr:hypothetical protein L602_004500000130 [Cupriavidus gilardii J11]
MAAHRMAERVGVHALARQPLQVDVGEDHVRVVGKTLRFGQHVAVFVDQRLTVPCEVGGGFALAGRAVQIRREATRRLLADQLMAIAGLADHDIRCGQVDQHGGPGKRRIRRRRNRYPDVLADFHVEAEQRDIVDVEQQPGAERHGLPQQRDFVDRGAVGRAELARLVELPVIRQIALGHHAVDLAAGHHHRAVEQLVLHAQRHADDQRAGQRARGIDHPGQSLLAGVQQRLLMEQVVAGIGRQAQFRKRDQRGAVGGGLARQIDGLLRVEQRVGDAAARHGDRDPHEAVRVQIEESAHVQTLCMRPRRPACRRAPVVVGPFPAAA